MTQHPRSRRAQPAADINLFIAFRRDHVWETPIYLGDVVNDAQSNAEARLGPDGTTLYFSSERIVVETEPRGRLATERTINGSEDWNNGLYNIWSVSLKPLIDCMRMATDEITRSACAVAS